MIELTYTGMVTPAELSATIKDSMALMQARGITRIFTDCTGLEGGHSAFHLFDDMLKIVGDIQALGLKEAILLSAQPAVAANVRFWETAGQNRGLNIRTFSDRTAALEWLLA